MRSISAVALLFAGCERPSPPTSDVVSKPGASTTIPREYVLKGKVRAVNAEQGVVTIAHEAIKGFMPAMTMDFTPIDKKLLVDVFVGDEVEGRIRATLEGEEVKDYDLIDLFVTMPGEPAPLVLSSGRGGLTVRTKLEPLKVGEAAPDFLMTSQTSAPLKLSDMRGHVVVLTFIYTRCPLPDFCPAADRKFGELAKRVNALRSRREGVRLLSVSFDPEHDTPAVLAEHAARVGAEPPLWTFATASHEELSKIAERFGLSYGPTKNEIIHNMIVAVISADGGLVRLETGTAGKNWTPDDLMKTITTALEKHKGRS